MKRSRDPIAIDMERERKNNKVSQTDCEKHCPIQFIQDILQANTLHYQKVCVNKGNCLVKYELFDVKTFQTTPCPDIEKRVEDMWMGHLTKFTYVLNGETFFCSMHPNKIQDTLPMILMKQSEGDTMILLRKSDTDMNNELWARNEELRPMFFNSKHFLNYNMQTSFEQLYLQDDAILRNLVQTWCKAQLHQICCTLVVNCQDLRRMKQCALAFENKCSCRVMLSGTGSSLFVYLFVQSPQDSFTVPLGTACITRV